MFESDKVAQVGQSLFKYIAELDHNYAKKAFLREFLAQNFKYLDVIDHNLLEEGILGAKIHILSFNF